MTDSQLHPRKHLLLLAYYFPPMGLSGVQRVSKLAKYLTRFGWDVTVVTARPRGYFAYDETLVDDLDGTGVEVIRTRSVDPTRLFRPKSVVGLPGEPKRRRASLLTNLLFVPDNKLGWYPFACRAASKLHTERPVDAVLSSAPPYTAHLVGRSVSRHLGVPLVVDFRDDWVGNPRHEYPTPVHRGLHLRLESAVLRSASAAITINELIADSLRRRCPVGAGTPSIHVIPQGYDPADFEGPQQYDHPLRRRMTLLYSGIFYDAQTPGPFLSGLRRAIQILPEMRDSVAADFVGLVPADFHERVQAVQLEDVVRYHGYESHERVVGRLAIADVLWFTIGRRPGAEAISTGKLYEYFGSRRPVLGLVPDGVARNDLERYAAGLVADPDDVQGIADAIVSLYRLWQRSELPAPDPAFVERFDRQRLAGEVARILEDTVSGARPA